MYYYRLLVYSDMSGKKEPKKNGEGVMVVAAEQF